MKFNWLITFCFCALPNVFAQNQPDALAEARALIAEGKAAAAAITKLQALPPAQASDAALPNCWA